MATTRARMGFGARVFALWKQGWNEIPEVMAATGYGLFGMACCIYGTYRYYKLEKYNHRYKSEYIIYRPEDERVTRIRKYEDSPQMTSTPRGLCRN